MNHWELRVTIALQEDIPLRNAQERLASLINAAMALDSELREIHPQNRFKQYSFCLPFPREETKVYRKGALYLFTLRTLSMRFAATMKTCLPRVNTGPIHVVAVDLKPQSERPVERLRAVTPVVATIENRCWTSDDGFAVFSGQIHSNLVRKAKSIQPDTAEPPEPFFESVSLLSEKPIVFQYKNTVLLGHKILLLVRPDPWAQALAQVALGAGLGEKNSLGCGYVLSVADRGEG